MDQQKARQIIQQHYEKLAAVYRITHPLPVHLIGKDETALNKYLDEQDAWINSEIFRLVPEDVRRAAV